MTRHGSTHPPALLALLAALISVYPSTPATYVPLMWIAAVVAVIMLRRKAAKRSG